MIARCATMIQNFKKLQCKLCEENIEITKCGLIGLSFSFFLFLNSKFMNFSELFVLKWKILSCFNSGFTSDPHSQQLDAT